MAKEPEIRVGNIHFDDAQTRKEILNRLRSLSVDPMLKPYWQMVDAASGRVLAEQRGGDVTINQDVCRDVLGEEV